jgi:hypothetical protein
MSTWENLEIRKLSKWKNFKMVKVKINVFIQNFEKILNVVSIVITRIVIGQYSNMEFNGK